MKIIATIFIIALIAVGSYMLVREKTPTPVINENSSMTEETLPYVASDGTVTASDGQCPGFIITSPTVGEIVTFPLTITGTIHPASNPGPWIVFEGEAGTVRAYDMNGNVLSGLGLLSLDVPWMNTDPKPFTITIPELISAPYTSQINLVFQDNNPAGPDEGQTHTCNLGLHVAL
ncbi:MAG: hypothetical protein KBC22_02560 [Candidatus Pacebacteria bacterium]|nr:hypothetical protein [Candidatus Paceibacterota bacterium]